jgi:hypothetical protein
MDDMSGFRVIWDGDSETDCVEICRDLQRAGIVYRVTQQPVSRSIRMRVIWKFRVGVRDTDYDSAKRALGLDREDEIEGQTFEIPESNDPISQSNQLDEAARAGSYLKPLDQNEATEEVWSQSPSDHSSMVELALKENLIRYRIQREENGRRKFLVAPGDNLRAREILRQIKNGEPPS